MTEVTIQIDRITRLSRGRGYRGLWMLFGIFMATFVARDEIDPEGAGEMWALLAFLYGSFMAVYMILPELAKWLPTSYDRTAIETSRFYATGLCVIISGFFLVLEVMQEVEHQGHTGAGFDLPSWLSAFLATGPWLMWPVLPKLLGRLHITVDKRGIEAKTSYFSRPLFRRWSEIDRIEAHVWAVRLTTKKGVTDEISLEAATDKQSDKVIAALVDIATAKRIPVEE